MVIINGISTCGVRYNSSIVNKEFLNYLAKHALKPEVCSLYKMVITQLYEVATGKDKTDALYKRQLNAYQIK